MGSTVKPAKASATLYALDRKYEILETLGVGSMGTVYLARHRELGRQVAIKTFRLDQQADLGGTRRFHQEARILAGLRHDRLVNLFESGTHEERPYLVMEYVEGEDLARFLDREGPLPVPRALSIAHGILEALKVIHGAGIVHRDLKPANVLLTSSGELKVTDFGLAKSLVHSGMHTATGLVLGTPFYMPPEQAYGERPHPSWDLYALATMLYEMLSGTRPFHGPDPLSVLEAKTEGPPRGLRRVAPGVPAALARLVDDALQEDPRRRPATAEAFARAIDEAMSARADEGGRPGAPWTWFRGGSGRKVLLVSCALLMALAASAAYRARTGNMRPFLPEKVSVEMQGDGAVIRWHSDEAMASRVLLEGMEGSAAAPRVLAEDGSPRHDHAITVSGLSPGSRQRFSILAPGGRRSLPRSIHIPSLRSLRLSDVELRYEAPQRMWIRFVTDRPVRSLLVTRRKGEEWRLPLSREAATHHEKLIENLSWEEDFGVVQAGFTAGKLEEFRPLGRVAGAAVLARELVTSIETLDPEELAARWLKRLNQGDESFVASEVRHVSKTETWRRFSEIEPMLDGFFGDPSPRCFEERMELYEHLLALDLLNKPFAVHGRKGPFEVERSWRAWVRLRHPRLSPGGRWLLDGRQKLLVFTSKGVGFQNSFLGLAVSSSLHEKIRQAVVHRSLDFVVELSEEERRGAGDWEFDCWVHGLHPFTRFELRRKDGAFVAFTVGHEAFKGFTFSTRWIPLVEAGKEAPDSLVHVVARVPRRFLSEARNELSLVIRCFGRFKRGDVFSVVGLRLRSVKD